MTWTTIKVSMKTIVIKATLLGARWVPGPAGTAGTPGSSAYAIWLSLWNTWTVQDFLNSFNGTDGTNWTNWEWVPTGWTTWQILEKSSDDDYDTQRVAKAAGGGASHFMELEGYRRRLRYNYAYTRDDDGIMYEYSNDSLSTIWDPTTWLNYWNSMYRCKKTGQATQWKRDFIYDSFGITGSQMEIYIYKMVKVRDSISWETIIELAKIVVDTGDLTARRWYDFSWTLDSPIDLVEWDMLSFVIVLKSPNDTNYYYLEDLYFILK